MYCCTLGSQQWATSSYLPTASCNLVCNIIAAEARLLFFFGPCRSYWKYIHNEGNTITILIAFPPGQYKRSWICSGLWPAGSHRSASCCSHLLQVSVGMQRWLISRAQVKTDLPCPGQLGHLLVNQQVCVIASKKGRERKQNYLPPQTVVHSPDLCWYWGTRPECC